MVQFPVSDTAVAIVDRVVGDNEEELDLINAFRAKPSQTIDQLGESSRFSIKKIEQLAKYLADGSFVPSSWSQPLNPVAFLRQIPSPEPSHYAQDQGV